MCEGIMVGATEVIRELRIPRTALYRLVAENRIPYSTARKPWQKREQYVFCVDAVAEALGIDRPPSDTQT